MNTPASKSMSVEPEKQHLYDVIVIGASQAGLAMGYYLHLQRKNFLILDGANQVGQSWRDRYDSLQLFTPAEYCNLPGWPLLLPKGHYPTKDQISDYLQQYAQHFALPVQLEQRVRSLTKVNSIFQIETTSQRYQAKQVVIATGPFQKPHIPNYATSPADHVVQVHSAHYRNPEQIPAGRVLVVGAGNSGAQIAVELAKTHEVHLSVRKKPRFSSLRMLGKSVFWWATKTGAIYASPASCTGRKVMKKADIIYGRELQQLLKKGQVPVRPEISGFEGATVQFKDGSQTQFSSIVWATGFMPDYSWLQIPGALAADGNPVHQNGIGPKNGLFYTGLSWQRNRSSALLLGAGRDAQYIAQRLD